MQNNDTSLQKLNEIRASGYRPVVVGCFLYDQKILMLYKSEHGLWQLPQGGIDNNELLEDALFREMKEELGDALVKSANKSIEVFDRDVVEFPLNTQGSRELKTDDGKDVQMKGKLYFFAALSSSTNILNLDETEFDDYKWLVYSEAREVARGIRQKGKRRITIKAIEALHEIGKI
ncbi:MAG: NUDIX hydrolase [Candidatus Uhrbacteria bacterium]|nr:NUDIX hydrolase [Candidatus Uhrbacteria bacterium]